MRLTIVFARPYRAWHARLRTRLEADGHSVTLQPVAARAPRGMWSALQAERFVYRSRSMLFEPRFEPVLPLQPGRSDCILSLDGRVTSGDRLALLFDGISGEAGMMDALLAGRAPRVSVADGAGRVGASGRPATERPDNLSVSIDHVLAAAIDVIVAGVRADLGPVDSSHVIPGLGPSREPDTNVLRTDMSSLSAGVRPRRPRMRAFLGILPLTFVARHLASKVWRRLARRARGEVRWHVAMRILGAADPDVATLKAWPDKGFTTLQDDGTAYLADPFPFEHGGRRFIFAEQFPATTRKGHIALVEIDAHGVASPPRVVLEQPGHLSYPVVFEAEGGVYMLPETSDAKCLRLFRADPFPDRWIPDRILVDDVVAADATPIFHDGLFWIFASLAGDGGSSWDRLGLFHAPSLLGPWTAHKANPVLIDAGAARPAGAMWHENGVLMRVAQDCRAGYGIGVSICRVDRLDRDGFAQTVIATLEAPKGSVCTHTLNRAGSLEVIDVGRGR